MKWEKLEGWGSSEHDEMMYDIVSYFILDEEPERSSQQQPTVATPAEAVAESQRRERKEEVDDKTAQLLSPS